MERSVLQVAAEAARFNGGVDHRRETSMAVYDPTTMPDPVVAPRGEGRRPSAGRRASSDARAPSGETDWSGNVVARPSRAHVASSVAHCLGSDMRPKDELAGHNQRKHYETDIRFQSVDPDAKDQPLNVATYQFGPGGEHTASVWKTEAQRLFEKDETDKAAKSEQSSKKSIVPVYAMSGTSAAEAAIAQARRTHEGVVSGVSMGALGAPTSHKTLSGHPSRGRGGSNSLLAGIGAKIAVDAPKSRSRPGSGSAAATAHTAIAGYQGHRPSRGPLAEAPRGNIATDEEPKPAYRELYAENYHGDVPVGYTGKRR